jgi:hypothetical protein
LNPTFVVLETKVVKHNPTLQEGGEERDWGEKQNQQHYKRERESFGVGGRDKDMKDHSFLQILTTLQERGRERERV